MKSNLSAVILAGGKGTRIGGKPKTEIIVGGEKIISRMLGVTRELFDEIIIVTNSPGRYSEYKDCIIIRDRYRGSGPLAGIHAALKKSQKEALFVFAGDMPFLDGDLINRQITQFYAEKCQALVPLVGSMPEPLHAIYSTAIKETAEKILGSGNKTSVRELLGKINTVYIKFPPSPEIVRAFANINSPADLVKAENIYL